MTAAKYLDCLGRASNDAAWKFIPTVYANQEQVTEQNVDQMLKGYVKDAGGNPDEISACAAKPETEKRIHDSIDLGQKLDVNSTPTFFINGRRWWGSTTTERLTMQSRRWWIMSCQPGQVTCRETMRRPAGRVFSGWEAIARQPNFGPAGAECAE